MPRKPSGRPNGRPPKNYDPKTFEGLCAIQCADAEIYAVLDGDKDSIKAWAKRHYGVPYPQAKKRFNEGGKASLRRKQYKLADRNAAMAIWLGKMWLGQKEEEGGIEKLSDYIKDLLDKTRNPLNNQPPEDLNGTNPPSD